MNTQPNHSFPKTEKLCHKKTIQELFAGGEQVFAHPFKLLYHRKETADQTPTQVLVSVSRRHFKRATDRNLLKRRMRELYRTHKHLFCQETGEFRLRELAIVYVGKEIMEFEPMRRKLIFLSKKIAYS